MRDRKNYYIVGGVLAFLVLLNIFFYFVSPEEIVATIGAENTYLIVFLLAAFGGLSTITGVAFYTTIVTFAVGGSDLFLLILAGGTGIFISDSIFFFLALYGRKSVPQTWEKSIAKVESWIQQYPSWMVLAGTYLYLGFTPLPNDLLMIALVIGGYTYRQIVWVLLAGNFTITAVTVFLAYTVLG